MSVHSLLWLADSATPMAPMAQAAAQAHPVAQPRAWPPGPMDALVFSAERANFRLRSDTRLSAGDSPPLHSEAKGQAPPRDLAWPGPLQTACHIYFNSVTLRALCCCATGRRPQGLRALEAWGHQTSNPIINWFMHWLPRAAACCRLFLSVPLRRL